MFNFDYITKEDIKEHNSKWPEIPQSMQNINSWTFWIWEKNALLNGVNDKPDTDKIYLYAKDPYEERYHLVINKNECTGLKYFNNSKAFIEYSNYMDDI